MRSSYPQKDRESHNMVGDDNLKGISYINYSFTQKSHDIVIKREILL